MAENSSQIYLASIQPYIYYEIRVSQTKQMKNRPHWVHSVEMMMVRKKGWENPSCPYLSEDAVWVVNKHKYVTLLHPPLPWKIKNLFKQWKVSKKCTCMHALKTPAGKSYWPANEKKLHTTTIIFMPTRCPKLRSLAVHAQEASDHLPPHHTRYCIPLPHFLSSRIISM